MEMNDYLEAFELHSAHCYHWPLVLDTAVRPVIAVIRCNCETR